MSKQTDQESSRKPTARTTGAWADGDLTALNHNEEFKQESDGLDVRQRILDIYSTQGFDSIPGDDLRGRMRWYGLYTQRKPGISGRRTASEADLDDQYFMLRIRSDGGQLTGAQLVEIGAISVEFARGTADITDRQNIQLHWIRIEDMPAIWRRLDHVGLSTTEACGDTPRVILGSPVAGVAADEIIDGTSAIDEIVAKYVGNREFSNLPRKFKTAISGSPALDSAHEINDVSFVGVHHPELGPGFDLWVGGGLSTNPMFAQRLGAWVDRDLVPQVWAGVISIFRDYGYRRLRNRARLKFLVADWGPAKFRQILETEYLGFALPDGPAPAQPDSQRRDHIGVHDQKDGRKWIGLAPVVGRINGALLIKIGELVTSLASSGHPSGRARLTAQQKLLILDVPAQRLDHTITQLTALNLLAQPSEFRRGTMACTGIEFCKLAVVDTKDTGAKLVAELEQRIPDYGDPLSIHINGCPNSCARFQVADIGLKGLVLTNDDGTDTDGFQVHLGGALGAEPELARKTRALRVKSAELPDYIEKLTTTYLAQRSPEQSFAHWVRQADETELQVHAEGDN